MLLLSFVLLIRVQKMKGRKDPRQFHAYHSIHFIHFIPNRIALFLESRMRDGFPPPVETETVGDLQYQCSENRSPIYDPTGWVGEGDHLGPRIRV